MKTLFAIDKDMVAIRTIAEFESETGVASGMNEALKDYLASAEAELGELLTDKVNGYAYVMEMLEAEAAMARKKAERHTKRAQALDNRVAHMRTLLLEFMVKHGKDKIESEDYTVFTSSRPSNKLKFRLPEGEWCDLIKIQLANNDSWQNLIKTTMKPNLERIKEALKAGQKLPEVEMEPDKITLSIR